MGEVWSTAAMAPRRRANPPPAGLSADDLSVLLTPCWVHTKEEQTLYCGDTQRMYDGCSQRRRCIGHGGKVRGFKKILTTTGSGH